MSELRQAGSQKVYSFPSDITSTKGIDHLFAEIGRSLLTITSAIHCATQPRQVGAQNLRMFRKRTSIRICRCNLAARFYSLRKYLAISLSMVVVISSTFHLCRSATPKFDHYEGTHMTSPVEYAAIKSGIISITRWLSKYHANKGIRVNCVSPGGILDKQPEVFLERYRQSCTNIGMLHSNQVANAIIFLLSSASLAINGQNLIVDDGWSL